MQRSRARGRREPATAPEPLWSVAQRCPCGRCSSRPIGIGRGLAAPLLPHHRTFGSRIRRFGRFSQGDVYTPTGVSSPGAPAASSSQMPDTSPTPRRMPSHRSAAGDYSSLPFGPSAKDVAARPICFSTFRFRSASLASPASHLLCPLLTSATRSGSLSTPSVPAGRVADLPG